MAFFDFLKPVEHAVGKGATAVGHGANSARKEVFHFLNGPPNTSVRTQLHEQAVRTKDPTLLRADKAPLNTFNPAKTVVNAAVSTARAVPRAGATIGESINQATGSSSELAQHPGSNPALEAVLGTEPVQSFQQRQKGTQKALKTTKLAAAAGPLSFLGVAGSLGLDVTPLGGGKKQAAEVLVSKLAKSDSETAIRGILKEANTSPQIIDRIAPALVKTKDKNVVANILSNHADVTAPIPAGTVPKPALINDVQPSRLPNDVRPVVSATPPVETVAPVATATPPPNAFDEILGAVHGKPSAPGQAAEKGLAAVSQEQAASLSKERGARFKASAEAGATQDGSSGYFKEKAALKGGYGQVDYKPLIHDIGPDRAEELFTSARQQIHATPDETYHQLGLHPGGARLSTQTAVRKVLGLEPGIPTKSELKLLSVFSPKLADEVKAATPVHRKILDAASILFGNARSIKSSLDLSMGGRQGLFVAARHPVQWAKANKESVKYAKDKTFYQQQMRDIHNDEWGKLIDHYNPSVLTGGASHEEAFANSDFAGKIPGIGASERAYTGGLTKLRKDILTKSLQAYGATPAEVEKKLGQDGVDGLIEAVSTLTGRGGKKGGFVAKHATTLQEALFSPRLWASRLQPLNPAFWARIGPAGRKEAIQSLGAFAAVAGVVLAAAVADGAEVETDPRSSDFLKIKVGDTRYDILGGFQQNIVFGARQITGSTKSSVSGATQKYGATALSPTRLSAAFDLVRNKSNPIVSSAANILEGKDKAGNKINPATEIGQLFVPISVQGSYHAIQQEGLKGLAKNSPDIVGIGTQTYGTKDIKITDKQQAYIDKNVTNPAQKKAYTEFFQTAKVSSGTKTNASDLAKAALAKGDTEKAISIAKEYNAKYTAGFDKWRKQYGKYRSDDVLISQYGKHLISDNAFDGWVQDAANAQGGN